MKFIKQFMMMAILLSTGMGFSVQAISVAEKAKELRKDTHFYMVSLETVIDNFGTEENKTSFQEAKKKYVSAVGFYYERDYYEAYRLYSEIQQEVETLAEDLSLQYIERTQKMLIDFTSRIIDLETKYDKNSELAKTLKTNRLSYLNKEVGKEVMSSRFYHPQIAHYMYDRYPILDNLEYGFGNLGTAKEAREKAQALDKYLNEGEKPSPRLRNKKIRAYLASIERCREGKANAIRMLQLYNRHDEYAVQGNATFDSESKEFKENPFLVESSLDPVFDPRIPEEYKIDAEDLRHRNYQEQVDMKVEGKAFGTESFEKQEKENSVDQDSNTEN